MILGQISVLTWRILTLKSGKGVPAGHLFHQMCILPQTRWQLEHAPCDCDRTVSHVTRPLF